MKQSKVESPCISICRYENEICVGCDRTAKEISAWLNMSDDEKQAVLNRLDEKNRGSFADWI